jgi:hypothetical protein
MHLHLLQCAPAGYHRAGIIFKTVGPDLLVRILPRTKIWGHPRWQMKIGGIPPLHLDRTASGRCRRYGPMCLSLLQMNEKVASQVPGFAIVRTRRKLAGLGPYFVREGGRHRQPRHQARKKRENQRLRKSRFCIALNRGDYISNGGWLWMGELWLRL